MSGLTRDERSFPANDGEWMANAIRRGLPETIAGCLILLYSGVFAWPQRSAQEIVGDIALCFFAALCGRWPRIGSLGAAVALLGMAVFPYEVISPAILALLIPIVSTAARSQRAILRGLIATAYLILAIATTIVSPWGITHLNELIQTIVIWGAMVGVAYASGRLINRRYRVAPTGSGFDDLGAAGARLAPMSELTHSAPAKRSRVPQWVGRLGRSGVPEAITGFLAFLYSETLSSSPDRTFTEAMLDFAICFFAGLSGRFPRIGTFGVGVVLLLMATLMQGRPLSVAVFTMFIPIVSNGAHGRTLLRDLAALLYFALAVIQTMPLGDAEFSEQIQTVIVWAVTVGLAWGAGRTVNQLREESRKQVQLRAEALRGQRRSIARDLHDTVSYATTTMIMRAEQIKLRTTGDPQLVEDLDFIIATGRRSVRDLRGMMETLRRNDPDLDLEADAPWRLLTVSDVIRERQAELAAHGLTLQVSTDTDLDALPVSLRETLGKLIVEATSNMVKHAGKGPCQLIIETRDDLLEAVFTNRLRRGSSHSETGTGLGIIGASERVRALGGELEATVASGAWILRAQLPLEG